MKINLDDLHEAMATWLDISDCIVEIDVHCNDMYKSLKNLEQSIGAKQIKHLGYLQKVAEHLMNQAVEKGERYESDDLDARATDLFLAPEAIETIQKQLKAMESGDKFSWKTIMESIGTLVHMRKDLDCFVFQAFGN